MGDLVILDGDQALFLPAFGPATVAVQPGRIAATGAATATAAAAKLCVAGDEASVSVPGCSYAMGSFAGGIGTLTIQALAPDQLAAKTQNGKKLILKGAQFVARFAVTKPAEMPATPPVLDPTPLYVGQGSFLTANATVTAS